MSAWFLPLSEIPQTVTSPPFHIQVHVQNNQLGQTTLKAVAVDSNDNSLQSFIRMIIASSTAPHDILVQPEEMFFFKAGESKQIVVSAVFSGDVRRDVTKSTDINYVSTNPNVAIVSSDGRVQAIAPGISTIEIRNPGASKTINISVGSFELRGDLDGDSDVDQDDLKILQAVLNTQATGPGDPRDLNNDTVINDLDSQLLTTLCSRSGCGVSIGPSII